MHPTGGDDDLYSLFGVDRAFVLWAGVTVSFLKLESLLFKSVYDDVVVPTIDLECAAFLHPFVELLKTDSSVHVLYSPVG